MGLSKDTFRYFSHDTDMRNDIKVKALRRKFANTGYAVWCFLLETLTDKDDFEIEYTPVSIELMAADFDVAPDELQEIIQYCVKVNLLQIEDDRLFSTRHKERITAIIDKKAYKSEIAKKAIETRWNKRQKETNNDRITDVLQTNNVCNTIIEEKRGEEKRRDKIVLPYQQIADMWNTVCSLPKVIKITEARKHKIRCRFEEFGCKTQDEALKQYRALLDKILQSEFLNGDNKQGWTATFDWLFDNPKNWVKVSEGNYSNDRGVNRQRTGGQKGLGVGEYITQDGKRTYGTGKANIPMLAPPRPSENYYWDAQSSNWIMQ